MKSQNQKRSNKGRKSSEKKRLYNVMRVRFPNTLKPRECDVGEHDFPDKTPVIVRTERGQVCAVTMGLRSRKFLPGSSLPTILRAVTENDERRMGENTELEQKITKRAVVLVDEYKLQMKVITTQLTHDRRRAVVFFCAENRVFLIRLAGKV